jgi:hypothetical protein
MHDLLDFYSVAWSFLAKVTERFVHTGTVAWCHQPSSEGGEVDPILTGLNLVTDR